MRDELGQAAEHVLSRAETLAGLAPARKGSAGAKRPPVCGSIPWRRRRNTTSPPYHRGITGFILIVRIEHRT